MTTAARRWPVALAGALALALAGGVTAVIARRGACAIDHASLAGWDDATRARIAARFADTGVSFARATWEQLARDLDRHAAAWTAARGAACTADDPDGRRTRCLDQAERELTRLLAAYDRADAAIVTRATDGLRGLRPLADCADPHYLDGLDATDHPEARAPLAAARVELFLGLDTALARARDALAAATAAGAPELRAEAGLVLGAAQRELGDPAAAEATLRDAVAAAPPAAVRVRIEAQVQLAQALVRLDRLDDADRAIALAEAALAAAPDPLRELVVAQNHGTQLGRRSDYAEALAQFERAQRAGEAALGADAWRLAATFANQATALRRLDRFDDAIAAARRAIALTAALGDDHPDSQAARRTLAQVLGDGGHPELALSEFRTLLAALRARHGEDHPEVAATRVHVGVQLVGLRRVEEAIGEFRGALAVLERVAPTSATTLNCRANLAEALSIMRRDTEALPLHRAVLAARLALLGEDHLDVAISRRNLGACLIALGARDDGIAELTRARAIVVARRGPDHARVAELDAMIAVARGIR